LRARTGASWTASPHREAGFVVTLGGRAERPAEDEQCTAWARECHTWLGEHAAAGVYVNFLSHDEGEERLSAALGKNAQRLRQIKTRYDPGNFFRRNHNIQPG
jgi:FAD/FMN-containing dehydrogenase